MIFRTIETDLNGAINKLGIFKTSFADIANAFKADGLKGAFNSIRITGISNMDIANIQKYNALVNSGVNSQAAFYQTMMSSSIAAKDLTASCNGAVVSQTILDGAAKATTGSLITQKVATILLKSAHIALNAVVGMGIGLLVSFVTSALSAGWERLKDAFKSTEERVADLNEKLKESTSAIKTVSDSFRELKANSASIFQRFVELAKGVDTFGHNVSLTDKEYKEFLELNNKIAEMFPELNMGMDSNGNAMLSLSYSADTLTDSLNALVEAERQAANAEIAKKMPETLKNISEIEKEYDKEIEKIRKRKEEWTDTYNDITNHTLDTDVGRYSAIEDGSAAAMEQIEKAAALGVHGDIVYDNQQATNNGYVFSIQWDYESINMDDVKKLYDAKIEEESKLINNYENMIAAKWKEINPIVSSWLQTDFLYNDLNDQMQEIANLMVSGLNFRELGLTTQEDVQNYITNNIVRPLFLASDDVKDVFAEITDLQSQLKNGEITTEEFTSKVQNAFSNLLGSMDSTAVDNFKNAFVSGFNQAGISGSNFDDVLNGLIDTWSNVDSISKTSGTFEDLMSSESFKTKIDDYISSVEELQDALSKLNDGKLESKDLVGLFEKFPELAKNSNNLSEAIINQIKELTGYEATLYKNGEAIDASTGIMKVFGEAFNSIDSDEAKAALEAFMDEVLKLGEVVPKTFDSLNAGISAVQDVLSSQNTGNSISVDDFNSNELKDYTSALEYNNGVLQLNAEKVSEIVDAKTKEAIATNDANKAMTQSKYLDNAAQIEKLRKKLKDKNFAEGESAEFIQANIDALLSENNALKTTCDNYDLMSASLREVTDAYHNWLNAQNAAQSGDMFDEALNAINHINDTLNNTDSDIFGRVGNEDYIAALEFIIPDSIDSEDKDKINAYLDSIYSMFTYDENGNRAGLNIENFCKVAVEKGLMVLDESGESYNIAGQTMMKDFAEGLNLSLPLVQAMFGEMKEFGGEFSWADETNKTIGDLAVSANVAAENLRELHSDMTITLDVSDLTTAKEKSDALDSTIKQMQDHKTTVGIDPSEIEYANSIISYCVTQKQQLENPAILNVDTSKVTEISESAGNAVSLLQEFKTEYNNLQLQKSLNVDTTDAQAKVDSLLEQIKSSDNDYIINLGLDTTSIDTLNTTILHMTTTDIKCSFNIDDSALLDYQPEDKKATVTYDVDTTAVDAYKPKDLTRTVTYYIQTIGNIGGNGITHIAGTAMAGGDWGTAQGGQTLTGELGREIVVDPHTGRWYTVGDTGAEFVNIPRGAIVFNHKQTESLLKNGYVAGRASALVGGAAMVTGGISVSSANNSSKSGGNSTSNYGKSSSSNNSSSESNSSDEDKIEAFDWIEIALSRIQRAIDNLSKKAESTFKKLSTRLSATNKEIGKVNKEINLQQKAADRYMKEANKVGLSEGLKEKVRTGSIQISEYDEDTQKLIKAYQDWYKFMLLYTVMYIENLSNCWNALKFYELQHKDEICLCVNV